MVVGSNRKKIVTVSLVNISPFLTSYGMVTPLFLSIVHTLNRPRLDGNVLRGGFWKSYNIYKNNDTNKKRLTIEHIDRSKKFARSSTISLFFTFSTKGLARRITTGQVVLSQQPLRDLTCVQGLSIQA